MDRQWIKNNQKTSIEFRRGLDVFLRRNFTGCTDEIGRILCPCRSCNNLFWRTIDDVALHVLKKGFKEDYLIWDLHGEVHHSEPSTSRHDMCDNQYDYTGYGDNESDSYHSVSDDDINDDANVEDGVDFNMGVDHGVDFSMGVDPDVRDENINMVNDAQQNFDENPAGFRQLLEDAEQPLYPGCRNFTKLSGLVKLFNLKSKFGFSDRSFTELLKLLIEMLPNGNALPDSMYKVKKTLSCLGLDYEKIHCCERHCILYRKEFAAAESCPKCGISRWKSTEDGNARLNVPRKVMWYFPPIPRFKRLFQNAETAKQLVWHEVERNVEDGKLRHPADSPQWKEIDNISPDFGSDARNLRLAIAADGINPHKHMSSTRSCWPVLMVIYNLPPSLSMKRKFMMMTTLISGPRQPGNEIDVYLQPLIEDLQLLWREGVRAWDAYKQEFFTLRAVLLWTINDFPAYGNLSGHVTKGHHGCPICSEGTDFTQLTYFRKTVYCKHRRWLPMDHVFRMQTKAFDGGQEWRVHPMRLSGRQIETKLDNIDFSEEGDICWKKKSIFFELDYWKHLFVRHNLDVMHIEKNVCDSIIGFILNIPGKTKDGLNARKDLQHFGLKPSMHPTVRGNRSFIPHASYLLTAAEKSIVFEILRNLKVPDGYSSNWRRLVATEEFRLKVLKSHDLHTLMQHILPVALRNVLPEKVRSAIMDFCFFFNAICKKEINVVDLDKIQANLVVTLCVLEKFFPPTFFDIMIHVTVHLVEEVRLCGPVYFRWMYPFERYMKVLKGYVRNHTYPEGCIAEKYIEEESIEFCASYHQGISSIGLPPINQNIGIGEPLGAQRRSMMSNYEWDQVHLYILSNTEEVQPYIRLHKQIVKRQYRPQRRSRTWIHKEHNRTFIKWFHDQVQSETNDPCMYVSDTLKWLANGPRHEVTNYGGYDVNGFRFHVLEKDNRRTTQNSGVAITSQTPHYSTDNDEEPIETYITYYGKVIEIWDVDYNAFRIPVFKCIWANTSSGMKTDGMGFTCVNFTRLGNESEPFIFAYQAKQVFYVDDPCDIGWSVVLSMPSSIHSGSREEDVVEDNIMEHHPFAERTLPEEVYNGDVHEVYVRENCRGSWVKGV